MIAREANRALTAATRGNGNEGSKAFALRTYSAKADHNATSDFRRMSATTWWVKDTLEFVDGKQKVKTNGVDFCELSSTGHDTRLVRTDVSLSISLGSPTAAPGGSFVQSHRLLEKDRTLAWLSSPPSKCSQNSYYIHLNRVSSKEAVSQKRAGSYASEANPLACRGGSFHRNEDCSSRNRDIALLRDKHKVYTSLIRQKSMGFTFRKHSWLDTRYT